jgi:hypothetical protein
MFIDRGCFERGCACYKPLLDEDYVAIPDKEWREPTSAEIKALWNATKKPSEFAALLLAKVKEKNT